MEKIDRIAHAINTKQNERDIVRLDLVIELPKIYHTLWEGAKIAHGLEDDFLSDLSRTTIELALIKLATFGG